MLDDLNRLLQLRNGAIQKLAVEGSSEGRDHKLTLEICIVGGRIDPARSGQTGGLLGRDFCLHLLGDGHHEIILKRQDIPDTTFITVCPEHLTAFRSHKLCRDLDSVVFPHH